MNDQDSASKYSRQAVLRKTDAAPSKQNHSAMSPPVKSRVANNTKPERLKAKKKEVFHSEMKNLGQLKKILELNFTWCNEFSDDEILSKDEKIELFELTILVNQTVGHMKTLQEAIEECKKSSEYWEDLFETIAEHFDEYRLSYIQYLSSMDNMQDTISNLKQHGHMKMMFNDLSWPGKEHHYTFERVLTYPRDRLRTLRTIIEEARAIVSSVGEGKTILASDKAELEACESALANINKILAADSSKSDIVKPKRYRRCRVIYSLRPGQEDELRLKENDIIEIISKNRNGWWQGRLRNNEVGWFPGNYVEELDDGGSSDSGSTDSTEKAGSSDEDGNHPAQSSSSEGKKSSNSMRKHENSDNLSRLQRQLSSADEARASAEARVQELILEAQRAKADAEARVEQLKKVLKSPKGDQRTSSHSSTDSHEGSNHDSNDEDRDSEEDGNEYEVDEYAADRAELNQSMKELDELALIATGDEPKTPRTKKKSTSQDAEVVDEYDDLECYFCKKVIQTYIPKEGKSYCPSCYDDIFTKKCFKCKKPITGAGLTYKEKPWHSDCFTCTHCDAPISGEKFISREDKPYCADCFGEMFAKRCTGCSKPIMGDNGMSFISSGGRSWHNECFVCTSCKDSLIGRGFFFTKEDNIVCPGCG